MKPDDIQSTLSALRDESNNIHSSDADSVDSLNQLIDKLEQQLSEPEISDNRGLINHMQGFIDRFEASHPTVTSIVNDLMVKLSGIGV